MAMLVIKCVWLILEICLAVALDSDQTPIISIPQGRLQGKTMLSNSGQEFWAFLGIPYGKVTKRFTKPEPGESWKDILNATQDGSACKQYRFLRQNSTTEDCLTMNIYTRKNLTDDSGKPQLPVLVHIYGGGFVGGVSNSKTYGPGRLMDGIPIVLVLFNYRIGPFGFLSTNDAASPGNYGLLDQVLALQWIQDNIKFFGGDPFKVTISGESAGGASVMLHIVSPLSKGLFHGAIAQSGHNLRPWSVQSNPLNITQRIAKKLACPIVSTVSMVECLRKVDADDLMIASNLSNIPGMYSMSTVPVIDGIFLTESPFISLSKGNFNKVPVISGVTADESASFFEGSTGKDDRVLYSLYNQSWSNLLSSIVHYNLKNLDNDTVKNAIKELYFHNIQSNDSVNILARGIELFDDFLFNSGNDKTVRLLSANGVDVFMYVFDYSSWDISTTNFTGRPDVSHTSELFLLFNKGTSSTWKYSNETEQVSKNIVNLWTNFAAYGNPTPSGEVQWIPVVPGAEHLQYLNISTTLELEEGYLTERMKFWNNILFSEK